LSFRIERFTTATTTSSYNAAALLITSRWPFVIGSYEPGHTTIDFSRAIIAGLVGAD
jgi:hypothetical protein